MWFFKPKIKKITKITGESSNPEAMSYYVMIRETIHGLDNLIVTIIHQSVLTITGALTLGVGLSTVITDPWGRVFLFIITVIAFSLTLGSHKIVKLYTDILGEAVKVAQKLEDALISDDSIKITKQIENNVKYAGRRGERIFSRGIKAFYLIELGLVVYLILSLFFCWEI